MTRLIPGMVTFVALTALVLTLALRDRAHRHESARVDVRARVPIELVPTQASTATRVAPRPLDETSKLLDARPAASPLAAASQPSESTLMAELRDLGATQPAVTLELARAANQRFNRSPDAPERAWYIVRALDNLNRRDEARAEALQMQRDYPGSTWSEDIYRHVLVNPGTHPAERGYGKTYELEPDANANASATSN